jgi:hypothetical protein
MGKPSKEVLVRICREAIGLGVALVCIGWVLLHLIGFFFYGYVLVGESNVFILLVEFVLTLVGLLCFIATLYKDKLSSKR